MINAASTRHPAGVNAQKNKKPLFRVIKIKSAQRVGH
jgi:hypothetical protein